MASGLYPGKGLELALASSNAREPVWASMRTPTYVIPTGSFSMGIALNAGLNTTLNVLYASAPAGTAFEVRYDIDPTFANEYVLDTVAAVALQTLYTWSTANIILLSGFIRIKNTGTASISECYAQQIVALGQ